jgi:hypothetical protein
MMSIYKRKEEEDKKRMCRDKENEEIKNIDQLGSL